MLNLTLKNPRVVASHGYSGEQEFICEGLTIRLDPFDLDYIRIECDPEIRETRVIVPAGENVESCVYSYIAEEL